MREYEVNIDKSIITNDVDTNANKAVETDIENHTDGLAEVCEDRTNKEISQQELIGSFDPDLPVGPDNQMPMLMVNPTLEQSDAFEVLKLQLDDPAYLSALSISEFSQLPEVSGLPKLMRMSLISKAIKQYNNGLIEKEVFIGLQN